MFEGLQKKSARVQSFFLKIWTIEKLLFFYLIGLYRFDYSYEI
jgi:hypothetical protein